MDICYTKIDERAIEPRNAYGNDAGWDLFVLDDYTIYAGHGMDMRTGLAVAIPDGYYGRIVARSSTMRKRGLMVMEGIIDAGFRGELFSYVYLPIHGYGTFEPQKSVRVNHGESVAQLIIQPVPSGVQFIELPRGLPISARGQAGFGSSGL